MEFLHHYGEIMTDPAHLLAEISLMLLIDVLLLGIVWPFMKSRVNKAVDRRVMAEHKVIDAEHGVSHNPDGTVALPPTHTAMKGTR